jgi:membrane-associated phospholipid phosphatase
MAITLPVPAPPGAPHPYGVQSPVQRADTAQEIRVKAAAFERSQPLPPHLNNGDETTHLNRIGNYSKGLPHDQFGEVDPAAYNSLLQAVNTGQPADFQAITLGGNILLVNPQAGLAFDLEGADSHALSIPPAHPVTGKDRAAEAVELYWMALCRDIPFSLYGKEPVTQAAIADLNALGSSIFAGTVTGQVLFRGSTPGERVGPYISQFFLQPAPFGALAVNDATGNPTQQYICYDAETDYMTDQASWLAVQNGQSPFNPPPPNFQFGQNDILGPRYLFCGRAGAAFVHVDELYQAYFMAALNLLDNLKFNSYDQTNPYQFPNPDGKTQAGFGTFGNPHVATLVAEVATRALKAQWYQKWFVHRTLRPEAYGGLVHFMKTGQKNYNLDPSVLNSNAVQEVFNRNGTYFLPMAYPEGSPQHPSYGSGHATVAGACATIIKAFFNEKLRIPNPVMPALDGLSLVPYTGADAGQLTILTEANKIAGNVGMFRNHAGVHWQSDHEASILLGEQIAISILQDQKWLYNENFSGWEFTRFDGTQVVV